MKNKKDKEIRLRVDDDFTNKVDYIQKINEYKNRSDTVRKVVEKEWIKETEYKGVATKIAEENALRFAQEKDAFAKRWLLRRGWDGKDMNQARELAEGYHIEEKWHQEDFGYTVTFTMCANDEKEKGDEKLW